MDDLEAIKTDLIKEIAATTDWAMRETLLSQLHQIQQIQINELSIAKGKARAGYLPNTPVVGKQGIPITE